MKKNILILLLFVLGFTGLRAQDSLYFRTIDHFKPARGYYIGNYDSVAFFRPDKTQGCIMRMYKSTLKAGYRDVYTSRFFGSANNGSILLADTDKIAWKPTSSDASYNNDYLNVNSRWNFYRSKESTHYIVFWDQKFGDDPNSPLLPSNVRVDINDLLAKAEQFYHTNVDKLKMVVTGNNHSQLDTYKMSIYLLYPATENEWVATGSGNDDMVGCLWVTPATCHPVGSTIAHEVGHTFQYQTYCDNIKNGRANDKRTGFRYTLPGSKGCGFWEQCAQWQSYQDYPAEGVTNYDVSVWFNNYYRHFENEWQRYASYWFQYYLTEKHGINALGRIWNESYYPEDCISCYTRLFNNNDYSTTRKELLEYAQKTLTFDYDAIRQYVPANHWDNYTTKLCQASNGWWQVAYRSCPAPTGFNAVRLNVPAAGTQVTVNFKGLPVGSALASTDNPSYIDGKTQERDTTLTTYNNTDAKGKEGWALGYVALKSDGSRVYGDCNIVDGANNLKQVQFTVPKGTSRLWIVIQGSPTEYRKNIWDDNVMTDDQLPYQIQVSGTTLYGYTSTDTVEAATAQYLPAKIYINTQDNQDVDSKTDYVPMTISVIHDYAGWTTEASGKIRGRGNSSWLWYDKKPYRIKLSKKQSIMGLSANKDWVLLANYRDPTDLMNTYVFALGEALDMPATNHTRYAEVTLNGEYIGLYQITEQVEVANNRVDIDKNKGILLELDADDGPQLASDETDNYWSAVYHLPCCVKNPKDPSATQVDSVKQEFSELENAFKNADFSKASQLCNMEQFVKYLLIQELVFNVELSAPRSVYLFKNAQNDVWHFGPLWDFDAGYCFNWSYMETGHDYFSRSNVTILGSNPAAQTGSYGGLSKFFTNMFNNKNFVYLVKQTWNRMKPLCMREAWNECQKYANGIADALQRDAECWPIRQYNDADEAYGGKLLSPSDETSRLKNWLQKRVDYLDSRISNY